MKERRDRFEETKDGGSNMENLQAIAHIKTDFPSKFGIPRQSCLVEELKGMIVFEPKYRNPDALRGLEAFSHIWLIWQFSQSVCETWSPTVRPPRLGGNRRMGVFATRSPFRPNSLGLSCVGLEKIQLDHREYGPVLYVTGADLMDNTPIFDIKPYVPHSDCHPEAAGGFSDAVKEHRLEVEFPHRLLEEIPYEKRAALKKVLIQDPRPAYQKDPGRIYGFEFAGFEIKFKVKDKALTVCSVEALSKETKVNHT